MFTGIIHVFYTHIYIYVCRCEYTLIVKGFGKVSSTKIQFFNCIRHILSLCLSCPSTKKKKKKRIHRNYSRTNHVTLIDLFNNFMIFDLLRAFHFALSFWSSEMLCFILCLFILYILSNGTYIFVRQSCRYGIAMSKYAYF